MTTIAWHKPTNTFAYDGRTTSGSMIVSDKSEKAFTRGSITFVMCGSLHDEELLINSYLSGGGNADLDCNALVHDDGKVYKIGQTKEDGLWVNILNDSFALGSGSDWAIAAMDFGNNAKEAVKYAMTRDTGTGGRIKEIKL